jgi:hypothetical protein
MLGNSRYKSGKQTVCSRDAAVELIEDINSVSK